MSVFAAASEERAGACVVLRRLQLKLEWKQSSNFFLLLSACSTQPGSPTTLPPERREERRRQTFLLQLKSASKVGAEEGLPFGEATNEF